MPTMIFVNGGLKMDGNTVRGSSGVWSIAASQDGQWIVSGDSRKTATIWNATMLDKVFNVQCSDSVYAIDISSDCTKFAAADWADVRIFGIASGTQLLRALSRHYVVGVKFSPDGS
ncbi:hypothetical protein PISMIDRAFT_17552 [Pisolithus microcarpus 441]|uniref:Uncharacterized protein n=1 Tax=Pisolithus microcarpus 441 TaxID=765257 RepID=A0A0C9YJU8_9AGAM|nr:hypothetical protein PISMIDRAFT_17552 [Pisolithus microcarpus 441]